jgi:hypothetical protein
MRLWYVRCKPCTYIVSRLGLSPNVLTQASTWAPSPRSTIECPQKDFGAYVMFGANHAPILHQHWHYLQTDRNNITHDPRHHGVPSGASKMISEAMVHLSQTVHLSSTNTNTLQTDRNEIPQDPCQVRPRRFLILWYVWRKPCTYLAPILTLSPNKPKWHSTRPTSPRSFVGCVQSDFWAYGTFGANRAPILSQDYHSP